MQFQNPGGGFGYDVGHAPHGHVYYQDRRAIGLVRNILRLANRFNWPAPAVRSMIRSLGPDRARALRWIRRRGYTGPVPWYLQ